MGNRFLRRIGQEKTFDFVALELCFINEVKEMSGNIERFRVEKLHGQNKCFDIKIDDNTLILVGDNGAGKTTVLQLLFHVLSGQFSSLAQYKFQKISITIDGKEESIDSDYIENYIKKLGDHIAKNLPRSIANEFSKIINSSFGVISKKDFQHIERKYGIPYNYLASEIDSFLNDKNFMKKYENLSKITMGEEKKQILYLPTYRRIERELELIFGKSDEDMEVAKKTIRKDREFNSSYVELIEFGMKDVVFLIDSTLDKIKDFARTSLNSLTLNYLGDVIDKKYDNINVEGIKSIPKKMVVNVLSRIPDSILSKEQKKHLSDTINLVREGGSFNHHAKVVCHYFLELFSFQNDILEQEKRIMNFFHVCNSYLINKKFVYNYVDFKYDIIGKYNEGPEYSVDIKSLSSGEKQVVSLFGHLYLSGRDKFIVLIDEPELSLSVPWQEKFLLDIRQSIFCEGLFAATHSPFTYRNKLKKYAHGLGEFI